MELELVGLHRIDITIEDLVFVELHEYVKYAEMFVLHDAFWAPMFDRVLPGYVPGDFDDD